MTPYRAPLRDMLFVLHELHGPDMPGGSHCAELSGELVRSVLEQAARFSESVLHPLSRSGDEEGCRFENGQVFTARGFRESFRAYAQAGWLSLACDPHYGGQGLPIALRALVEEMICSANLNFASYTNLIQGAYAVLHQNASEELKAAYLPALVSGAWAATMCLSEAQSGSDLRLLRSKAIPRDDGSYSVTGQKAFISAGDHDLTDNIVHLVLARLPDAPAGTRGISLFLVPKLLPDADGRATRRNSVHCVSLEAKMGLKASATCSMSFDGATGWLVGVPHCGLEAMFTMMNAARLGASLQGLGIAQAAYQAAVAYARERLQGRASAAPENSAKPADPIIFHPDVRRMLLTMRASVEGMRALVQWVAQNLDLRERHPDPEARRHADEFVSLMTPVLKAMFTELGSECANLGVQVLGGAGYIRKHGMEQLVRDVRVTQIYDGTNGIQALDLVMRKIGRDRLAGRFFEPVRQFLAQDFDNACMKRCVQPFTQALKILEDATGLVETAVKSQPERCAAAATDYLRLFGLVALGFMWVRMAVLSVSHTGGPEADFYRAKLATARFFLKRLPPQVGALSQLIATADTTLTFDPKAF